MLKAIHLFSIIALIVSLTYLGCEYDDSEDSSASSSESAFLDDSYSSNDELASKGAEVAVLGFNAHLLNAQSPQGEV